MKEHRIPRIELNALRLSDERRVVGKLRAQKQVFVEAAAVDVHRVAASYDLQRSVAIILHSERERGVSLRAKRASLGSLLLNPLLDFFP